ncbi:hypothetical protein RB195_002108 [Necator americanus]|uniref:TLC domain-containing protein n=1 Tax=Necator americanus TaxID=51031 RepID=A0ABR1DIU1_NECAM
MFLMLQYIIFYSCSTLASLLCMVYEMLSNPIDKTMDTSMPFIPGNFYAKPFPVIVVDNHTEFGEKNDAEWHVPDYRLIFSMNNVVPLICYALIWYCVNLLVNAYCWTTWKEGFRRRRLINLTTSLIHSTISGGFLLVYFLRNARLMFASPMHYYSYLELQVVLFSIGYFVYDSVDMAINDTINVNSVVLLFHHLSSVFFLSVCVNTHKFLLYSYWALLMEVSSIFLHCRSLLNQSKLSTSSMIGLYKAISYLNIAAFLPFRFFIQLFLILWAFTNIYNMHWYYFAMWMLGSSCFIVINGGLFLRILHSDGFLCSKLSKEQLGGLAEDSEYKIVERDELLEKVSPPTIATFELHFFWS